MNLLSALRSPLSALMTSLLVVRLSALGDVIHTIPAVVALRERYDDIAWAVETPKVVSDRYARGAHPMQP